MKKKSHLYYSNNIFIYEESGKPVAGFCSSNSLNFAYLKKKIEQKNNVSLNKKTRYLATLYINSVLLNLSSSSSTWR